MWVISDNHPFPSCGDVLALLVLWWCWRRDHPPITFRHRMCWSAWWPWMIKSSAIRSENSLWKLFWPYLAPVFSRLQLQRMQEHMWEISDMFRICNSSICWHRLQVSSAEEDDAKPFLGFQSTFRIYIIWFGLSVSTCKPSGKPHLNWVGGRYKPYPTRVYWLVLVVLARKEIVSISCFHLTLSTSGGSKSPGYEKWHEMLLEDDVPFLCVHVSRGLQFLNLNCMVILKSQRHGDSKISTAWWF